MRLLISTNYRALGLAKHAQNGMTERV